MENLKCNKTESDSNHCRAVSLTKKKGGNGSKLFLLRNRRFPVRGLKDHQKLNTYTI